MSPLSFSLPPSYPPFLPLSLSSAYYYHNIHFRYTLNAPTFKSIRHSYYKMQGLLENTSMSVHIPTIACTVWEVGGGGSHLHCPIVYVLRSKFGDLVALLIS